MMTSDATDLPTERVDSAYLREIFGDSAGKAQRYHDLLSGEAIEWGLLGPREGERIWCRHILNSAAIHRLIPIGASVLDVGSGAGLPGIPLALARPDIQVTLMESLLRRVKFLQLCVDELELAGQVSVVRARAEETTKKYDVVVARAVAPLSRLVHWCAPLMDTCLLAMKGDGVEQELQEASLVLEQLRLSSVIEKVSAGPDCPAATVVKITH